MTFGFKDRGVPRSGYAIVLAVEVLNANRATGFCIVPMRTRGGDVPRGKD